LPDRSSPGREAPELGQRVEIEGTIADRKDGKVEIKTETKAEGPAKDTQSKVETSGPFLPSSPQPFALPRSF